MTRKHFTSLAWELRQRFPEPVKATDGDLGSDFYAGRVRGWESAVLAVSRACADSNPAFDYDRFAMAAGLIRRPDGSMFPMAAPR
jgi:hypothetical protein